MGCSKAGTQQGKQHSLLLDSARTHSMHCIALHCAALHCTALTVLVEEEGQALTSQGGAQSCLA